MAATRPVYAILQEDTDISEGGIEFDLPPELHKKVPKALLSSIRRLHFNSGHPPNAELERIVRLSGGSEIARAAVKGIRCSVCRKASATKSAKPGKVRTNIGQFNDTLFIAWDMRKIPWDKPMDLLLWWMRLVCSQVPWIRKDSSRII